MDKAARWNIPPSDSQPVAALACALGIQAPAARVLWNRGYRDAESAGRFLRPDFSHLFDPYLLRDMDAAAARLHRAVTGGEKILLYGDYDVDGTMSVVILKKAIELAGGSAGFHVPHRLRDGYGMRPEVVERAAEEGVSLIISVDTGIRAAQVVTHAREFGIDCIITDHHLPEEELPPAVAVLNPNRADCTYPEKNLCGAAVAFKLIQALLGRAGWADARIRRLSESFLKLVAIATVADVVPLTGENRTIVKCGLDGLTSVRNAGLRALLDKAGFAEGSAPSAGQVAFRVAPRINAAGRMANAADVIELFETADPSRAADIAAKLHCLNEDRRSVEQDIAQAIVEECARIPVTGDQFGLVFCGQDWHRGVVGIVASRVVERFHRPAFVLSADRASGLAQGSGRSIRAFHLLEALESMADLFERFGGHRQAAGVTLAIDRVEEFRRRFNAYSAERLTPADLIPQVDLDSAIDFHEVNDRSIGEILTLAPFGSGNPAPLFVVRGAEVAGEPVVWKENHLRLSLRQNGRSLQLKAWNFAARSEELEARSRVDAVLCFEDDPYSASRGYPGWSAVLKDVRRAG